MVEYIPCLSAPTVHWGFLPATGLASRIILIEQNIKKRTGPALWLLCGTEHKWGICQCPSSDVPCVHTSPEVRSQEKRLQSDGQKSEHPSPAYTFAIYVLHKTLLKLTECLREVAGGWIARGQFTVHFTYIWERSIVFLPLWDLCRVPVFSQSSSSIFRVPSVSCVMQTLYLWPLTYVHVCTYCTVWHIYRLHLKMQLRSVRARLLHIHVVFVSYLKGL